MGNMNNRPVYVTMPSLAPLHEYTEILKGVWDSGILTHNGPLVQSFEDKFKKHYNLKNMVAVSNGTIAIQMAIKSLKLKGEIITSPFTWVATVSAIMWEGCTPVFADIDPGTLNIDPAKIEEKITPQTKAILPIHVFGNACEVELIEAIAKKHKLKVIYDAAHAVGVNLNGCSLLEYGDVSATSFHATKLLNTAEGGGCITTNSDLYESLKRIRFFGHDDDKDIVEEGFNGKMTEIHAALGLANLKYVDEVLFDRRYKYFYYKENLERLSSISFQKINGDACNFSYFPIIFETENLLKRAEAALKKINVYPRRYFYPSVNTYTKILQYQNMPISEDVSKRILCLPLYRNLDIISIDKIIDVVSTLKMYN